MCRSGFVTHVSQYLVGAPYSLKERLPYKVYGKLNTRDVRHNFAKRFGKHSLAPIRQYSIRNTNCLKRNHRGVGKLPHLESYEVVEVNRLRNHNLGILRLTAL